MAGGDTDLNVKVNVETKGVDGLSKLNDQLGTTEEKTGKLGSVTTGVFQGIGQAVASAGLGLAKAGLDFAIDKVGESITLASDKAEAASKVNVLFADSADTITAASETAATTVGLSSGAYLTAAGNIGNLVTNLGFAGDEAANMTTDIVQLSADMGSFNNLPTDQAVNAIGAAFRGETEPIRAFGVMLNDASVKAKAVEMGLYSGVGALDANAKAQATYQLILEGTTAAQGDFARTADGLANSQKINAARMDEAFTRIGEALLPLVNQIMPVLADVLVGIAEGIGDLVEAAVAWLDDNQAFVDSMVDLGRAAWDLYTKYLGALVDIIGELGYRVGGIIGLFVDLAKAIVDTGAAMVKVLSGDFAGAAADAERAFGELGSFQENVQRAMGDSARKQADEVLIVANNTAAAQEKLWGNSAAQAALAMAGVPPLFAATGKAAGTGLSSGLAAALGDGTATVSSAIAAQGDAAGAAAYQLGKAVPGDLARGMQAEQAVVKNGAEALRNILKTGVTPEEAATQALGKKYVDLVERGLKSGIPGAKETAQEVAVAAIASIDSAGLGGKKGQRGLEAIGRYYDDLLASGLTKAQATAALAAAGVSNTTINALDAPAQLTKASNSGDAIADAWVGGLVGTFRSQLTQGKIFGAMNTALAALHGHSPPRVGPLRNIDDWGANVGDAWLGGMRDALAASDVLGALSPNLGPDIAPGSGALVAGGGGGGRSSATYQVVINAGVGDPVEIGRQVVAAIGEYERASGRDWRE